MAAVPANHRVWGGGGERPIRVRTVERHAVPRAPPPQFEDQLNTPQRKALLSPRESLIFARDILLAVAGEPRNEPEGLQSGKSCS